MFQLNTFVLLIGIFGVFAIILFASLFLLDRPTRHVLVGFLTCASLISMFASPLFIIVSFFCTNNILFVLSFWIMLSYHVSKYNHANSVYLFTEIGDPDKECWIHAVLPLPFNICNEFILYGVWDLQFWPLCLCKLSYPSLLLHEALVFLCDMLKLFLFNFQVPNGIGTILGTVQLSLFLYYERKDTDHSREPLIESFP